MNAHQIVAKARTLPQVSDAALRLTHLLDEFSEGCNEAADVIRSDSLLTAKLLRVCNSSAFGFSERIASVEQAFMLLGVNEVRRMVLSLGFAKAMTGGWPGATNGAEAFREHALMTAAAAENVAVLNRCAGNDCSAAFTAGLLHDIGKVIMSDVISPDEQRVIANHMKSEGLGSVEAEREVLGTDHAEVGACLLHIWRLPAGVVEAVARHHAPAFKPQPQLSAIVHAANRIAHLAVDEQLEDRYRFSAGDPVVQSLNWNDSDQESLISEAQKSLERARGLQAFV